MIAPSSNINFHQRNRGGGPGQVYQGTAHETSYPVTDPQQPSQVKLNSGFHRYLRVSMKVVRSSHAPSEEMTGGIFTGTVKMTPLINADTGANQLRSALVYFLAGVRNKLHSHTHEQIFFVTKGKGIVATEDHEHVVKPGDVVVVPAGEMHWHGAIDDTDFERLYVVPLNSETAY